MNKLEGKTTIKKEQALTSIKEKAKKPQKDICTTYQAVCRFLNTNDGATPHYYLGYN